MKLDQAKSTNKAVNELCESSVDLIRAVKNTANAAETAKKLWREGNDSKLIKIGVALIMFPEPTPISETIGACLVAAGAVKKGLQNRSLYLEDVTKTFKSTLKDIMELRNFKV